MNWKDAKKILRPIVVLLSPIHPTILTFTGFLIILTGCFLLLRYNIRIGGIIILIGGIFDTLDGEVARYTKKITRFGAFIDSTLDRYSEFFIIICVGFVTEKVILSFFALLGSFLTSYIRARGEGLGIEKMNRGFMQRPERFFVLVIGMLLSPRALITALWLVTIGSNFTAIQRIIWVWKNLKKEV